MHTVTCLIDEGKTFLIIYIRNVSRSHIVIALFVVAQKAKIYTLYLWKIFLMTLQYLMARSLVIAPYNKNEHKYIYI